MIVQSRKFFKLHILPEILGKFYTRRQKDQGQKAKPCYYKNENVGTTTIACDNVECEIEWFHVNCLQLENIPKGK